MTRDNDNWIGIVIPTKDGKYKIARATIDNKDVDKLSDCIISVSDAEGKLEDLKYPFVLVKDIDVLKEKLIDDLKKKIKYYTDSGSDINAIKVAGLVNAMLIIDRRFGRE